MSSKSDQTTVGDPKELLSTDSTMPSNSDGPGEPMNPSVQKPGEPMNPSVQKQGEQISNEVETLGEEKRQRTLSQKAVQNAIQTKHSELHAEEKALKSTSRTVYNAIDKRISPKEIQTVVASLEKSYAKYKTILGDLLELYGQDKWSELSEQAQETAEESEFIMKCAHTAILEAENYQRRLVDETASTTSRRTRRTTSSHRSISSTDSTRRKALADAAAAKQQAQFDRKENERKKIEAEEELRRKLLLAQHERDMAILSAEKATAVADARLEAIEQSILDEEKPLTLQEHVDPEDVRSRTEDWVNTIDRHHQSPTFQETDQSTTLPNHQENDRKENHTVPQATDTTSAGEKNHSKTPKPFAPRGFAGNQPIFKPSTSLPEIVDPNQCIQGIAKSNEQLVASLARQSLPKCHPDIFDGDATLFHPWKNSLKAMMQDAKLNPAQEMSYIRSYTKGKVQELVDNYRKRQQDDPAKTLRELWMELERRFGNTAIITNSLLRKLQDSAKFSGREKTKLQAFADVCTDVDNQMNYLKGLACLNYPTAIGPILDNLPNYLKLKWEKRVVRYAEENDDAYPSFHTFATMVQLQARLQNHPNILANVSPNSGEPAKRNDRRWNRDDAVKPERRTLKTGIQEEQQDPDNATKQKYCPFHERKGHTIHECVAFGKKTLDEKTTWIKTSGLCFRCLTAKHRANQCKEDVSCDKCKSNRHPTILHKEKDPKDRRDDGEEVLSRCTSVCQGRKGGLSCSKIVLADVFAKNEPANVHRVYAIMDDQSNTSMVSPSLVDRLEVNGPSESYLLSTCSNTKEVKTGRRISGLVVRSPEGHAVELPTLIECDNIPQDKSEIPTPTITDQFPHLRAITKEIPPIDNDAKIEILIGRDSPELLKVRAFKNGPKGAPWAQKLSLGWTVSGQVCLDRVGGPVHVTTQRTTVEASHIEQARRPEFGQNCYLEELETTPCPNYFRFQEQWADKATAKEVSRNIYHTTPDDNITSVSQEDRRFLHIMNRETHKDDTGNWEMPLPFRSTKVAMPNNRQQAANRLLGLLCTFKKKPKMEKDYFEFLGNVIKRGHAVLVPPNQLLDNRHDSDPNKDQSEDHLGHIWYLPHFGVYHPKKPNQIRVVFDSSCEYRGVSLNKELLAGPDMMNSLIGVLMRFRQENVGAVCDIEQMFHSFHVAPKHRDFLRFLWFRNNDPSEEIVEYRMVVHLFGNGPSPAVATFGLRKTADEGEEMYGAKVRNFIHRDFYVDDGLTSQPTDEDTIELIKGAQASLSTANLRLHKVASNSVTVMESFPIEDRAKDIRDMDLRQDALPAQRSLGVQWDLQADSFTFKVSLPDKPYTRRGVLSVVNSVYDPLGLAAPVILVGKLILQQLVIAGKGKRSDSSLSWDDPLPENLKRRWRCWKDELPELERVSVQRCYHPKSFDRITRNEVHAFSDASKEATGTAVYLKQIDGKGAVSVSLVYGQAKVAPVRPISIPRLELCAAVLSTQAVERLKKELDLEINEVTFYTDSKVVLGYIKNETRRFHVYVANRVQLIRDVSEPRQWKYVDISENPADLATRGTTAKILTKTTWLSGPSFLNQNAPKPLSAEDRGTPVSEKDPEVQKQLSAYTTNAKPTSGLGADRFKRFSNWSSLRRAVARLIKKAKESKAKSTVPVLQPDRKANDNNEPVLTPLSLQQSTSVIIKTVQREAFATEIAALERGNDGLKGRSLLKQRRKILQKSTIYRLDPFVDPHGILRVGGRLQRSDLTFEERHPVLLPKQNHLSTLLIRHYHEEVCHQGRQITRGALRQAGYWVVGGQRMISSIVSSCVICKRLRGKTLTQKMADLPIDRLDTNPPFTSVGVDVFGPWMVRTRKTRSSRAESKRWGLIFSCLNSRAIHIEVLQSMDTDAFICALRRFFAIRGPAAMLRCDCGTNFVGAKSEFGNALKEMDQQKIERYVTETGCEWMFNPPHASHFGGAWERQIGTIRRVLNAMLLTIGSSQLDDELLVTLMAEVAAIVNNRPLTAISSDTDEPKPLTASMLLTMKPRPLAPPPGKFIPRDLYARRRWQRSQYLADQFWVRWKREYLQSLQVRPKWCEEKRNLAVGDVVILRDKEVFRNEWPLGRVIESIASQDGKVRKAKVVVVKHGKKKTFFRPINEIILLLPTTENPEH